MLQEKLTELDALIGSLEEGAAHAEQQIAAARKRRQEVLVGYRILAGDIPEDSAAQRRADTEKQRRAALGKTVETRSSEVDSGDGRDTRGVLRA